MIQDHAIYHCSTNPIFTLLTYRWCITQFMIVFNNLQSLLACKIENLPFNIIMYCEKEKSHMLLFCTWFEDVKKKMRINYSISIQTSVGEAGAGSLVNENKDLNWKCIEITHNVCLYELPIKILESDKSVYLPDDTLTICFHFKMLENLLHDMYEYIPYIQENSNLNTTSNINLPSDSCNLVKFVINKKEVYIRKDQLYLQSDYFKVMFDDKRRNYTNNEIVINIEEDDITYDIINYLSFYIDTGTLKCLDTSLGAKNIKTLHALIKVANKYSIYGLTLLCEQLLIKNITIDNVANYLSIAYLNKANFLEKYAIKYIKLYQHIVDIPNLPALMNEHPALLNRIKEL